MLEEARSIGNLEMGMRAVTVGLWGTFAVTAAPRLAVWSSRIASSQHLMARV